MTAAARRVLLLASLLAVAGLVSAGSAQSGSGILFAIGSPRPVSTTSVDVKLAGSLTVAFHGDPGTGCAAKGVCDYSGVVVWSPAGEDAGLLIAKFDHHGRVHYDASLFVFGNGGGGPARSVSAVVRRVAGGQTEGTCADASSADSNSTFSVSGNRLLLKAMDGHGSVLATRCAGPLDGDVAGSLPATPISISTLRRGHRKVDLGGTVSFAANGFAGTIQSTLVLVLGSSSTTKFPTVSPKPSPGRRMRIVTETLRLTKLGGGLSASVRGSSSSSGCGLLDSCAAFGSITLTPRVAAAQVQGELTAQGPARRPYRDFLAALGLNRNGNPAGIIVVGSLGWDSGGTLSEALSGPSGCQDSRVLAGGGILLQRSRGRLNASYTAQPHLRVRCPGPDLATAVQTFASGTLSLPRLAQRQFSITLKPPTTFSDDGYTGTLSGGLTVRLRRGAVKQTYLTVPTPPR